MEHGQRRDGATNWTVRDFGGPGSPVVALHGLGASASDWEPLARALAPQLRVIAVELPGYTLTPPEVTAETNRSDAPPSVARLAYDLLDVVADLRLDSYILLGHSFGAAVALFHAGYAGGSVSAVVLLAPGGFGPELNPVVSLLGTRVGRRVLAAAHRPRINRAIHRLATNPRVDGSGIRAEDAIRTYDALATPAARARYSAAVAAATAARDTELLDLTKGLDRRLPILIIWGRRDQVLPSWQAKNAQRLLPHAQVQLLAGVGHTPHRSHPDLTAAMVMHFLRLDEENASDGPTVPSPST